MTTQAQYASIPKLGKITLSVANTLRDGTGAMGTLLTASPIAQSGTRVDKIQMQALGDTTTGMLRFFLVKGAPGAPISSITFSDVTATVTTTGAHGLNTGDLLTLQNAMPDQYNVTNVAVAVTAATTFTYQMSAAPMVAARAVGAFSIIKAGEVGTFWRDIPVTAATVIPRAITTITFSTTTATVTTATPHGLSVGDTVVVVGATPAQYNGTFVINTAGLTTFTYTMASAPATNASVVGSYSVPRASFSAVMHSQSLSDVAYLPLALPAGYQLRVATNNAEQFSITSAYSGDFA